MATLCRRLVSASSRVSSARHVCWKKCSAPRQLSGEFPPLNWRYALLKAIHTDTATKVDDHRAEQQVRENFYRINRCARGRIRVRSLSVCLLLWWRDQKSSSHRETETNRALKMSLAGNKHDFANKFLTKQSTLWVSVCVWVSEPARETMMMGIQFGLRFPSPLVALCIESGPWARK